MTAESLIEAFWSWFVEHADTYDSDRDFINELESRLFAICRVDWEIGPLTADEMFLALSPRESSLELVTQT